MRPPSRRQRKHLNAFIEARRRSHPHTVRQPGLLRSRLGDDEFLRLQDERRRWIEENCKCPFWVDILTEHGKEAGKLYRFADLYEADWFRYRF